MTKLRTQKDEVLPVIPADIVGEHRVFFDDLLKVMASAIRNTRLDLDTINSAITDVVHPVGSFYVQFADANSNTTATAFPDAYAPATLFGGTWAKQWDTEGISFKTEGDVLSQTNGELNNRTNGLQTDMLQGHWHNFYAVASIAGYGGVYEVPGSSPAALHVDAVRVAISDGTNGTPRLGKETRPRNRMIRVWKRTA